MTRETIIEMIRQLQNKTLDNGCTEAEAMSAALKAGELMAKYNITLDSVYLGNEKCITIEINCGFRVNYADYFIGAVARYCDCKVYSTVDDRLKVRKYCLFGLPVDAKMADYLYTVINRAMDVELTNFKNGEYYFTCKSKGISRRMASGSFLKGMAARIASRLNSMKEEISAKNSTEKSTGIIVIKNAKVEREYELISKELDIKVGKEKTTKVITSAYNSGEEAGNRVNLNRPLSGSTASGYIC